MGELFIIGRVNMEMLGILHTNAGGDNLSIGKVLDLDVSKADVVYLHTKYGTVCLKRQDNDDLEFLTNNVFLRLMEIIRPYSRFKVEDPHVEFSGDHYKVTWRSIKIPMCGDSIGMEKVLNTLVYSYDGSVSLTEGGDL